jgi:hypothetical protein
VDQAAKQISEKFSLGKTKSKERSHLTLTGIFSLTNGNIPNGEKRMRILLMIAVRNYNGKTTIDQVPLLNDFYASIHFILLLILPKI